jgi:hypothetical protein
MEIESLRALLYTNLIWHPARIETFYNLVKGIILAKTVTIKELALHIESSGNIRAKIAKIERLFKLQVIDYSVIAMIIISMIRINSPYKIAIDRTNWKFGKKDINFFVASIVVHNISVPILWILLNKQGNTSTSERVLLIDKIVSIIGIDKVEIILGDREFVGEEWLRYLVRAKIPFAMRTKKSEQIRHENGGRMSLGKYFSGLKEGEVRSKEAIFYGMQLHLTCLKLKDETLFIVSNIVIGKSALEAYKQRWTIERAFKALKSSGFNFEDTHITDKTKLAKLFAVAAIALAICVISGKIKNELVLIKTKKHGRNAFSLFTYGLDWLKNCFYTKNQPFLRRLLRSLNQYIALALE